MSLITPAIRELIESGRLAHLVTLNEDGSPQVTIVWVGLDGEEIVSGHLGEWKKVANVPRDARVTVSMESGHRNAMGLDGYLVVSGRARVTEGGAPELLQQLAHTYLGPGVKFPPMDSPPPGFVLHITAEKVGGVGPWTGT